MIIEDIMDVNSTLKNLTDTFTSFDNSTTDPIECSVNIRELYLLIIIAIESFLLVLSLGMSIYLLLGKRRLRGEGIINQTFEGEEGDYIRPAEPQLRLYETILHLSPSRRSSRGENPYEILNINNNNNNNDSTSVTSTHILNNHLPVQVAHSREHSYDNIIESKENGSVPNISELQE